MVFIDTGDLHAYKQDFASSKVRLNMNNLMLSFDENEDLVNDFRASF